MVEETEYDDVVTCKHSYSEKCHTTYTTDFEPQQEEDCEENFVKSCFIEYKKVASEEAVTFCHTPILLEGDGDEICKTVYESACTTRYEEHDVQDDTVECETIQEEKCEDVTQGYTTEQKCTKWPVQKCKTSAGKVKKYSPETECKKVPREVCGPGTTQVPGNEECFDRKETVSTSPNWFLFLSQLKNALISQKKYALDPVPTQERSKNQLSRNGVTYQLLNLVWLKQISKRLCCIAHYDSTFCLSNFLFGNLYMLVTYSKMPQNN